MRLLGIECPGDCVGEKVEGFLGLHLAGLRYCLGRDQGWQALVGFITAQTADKVEMRDIAGQVQTVKATNIKSKHELETSMMPAGLANSLSMEDFASLIAYLASQKK